MFRRLLLDDGMERSADEVAMGVTDEMVNILRAELSRMGCEVYGAIGTKMEFDRSVEDDLPPGVEVPEGIKGDIFNL